MPRKLSAIGLDADDTLWQSEQFFKLTEARFVDLLAEYAEGADLSARLLQAEMKNLQFYGFGTKSFVLSMIETAIELSEGRITGAEISQIIDFAKEMLKSPIELLDAVEETVKKLSQTHELMIITKGDLFDQESKIARSGLADYFSKIEIVKEKDDAVYQKILSKYQIDKNKFVMVGNALKSDILPVLRIGASAIHIPYHTTWAREVVEGDELKKYNFLAIRGMNELLGLFV